MPAMSGLPEWILMFAALLVVTAVLVFLSRRGPATPGASTVTGASSGSSVEKSQASPAASSLDAALLSIIPNLKAEHRWGVAQSVLGGIGREGIDEDSLRGAGVDTSPARAGDSKGLKDLIAQAAAKSPRGLRDGLGAYARNVPTFLGSLPPSDATQLKGALGFEAPS